VVEQEKHNALRVHLLEDFHGPIDLCKELHMIPPLVAAYPQIHNAVSVLYYNAFLIVDDKMSILFLDEI
jgi:hypothetical protein